MFIEKKIKQILPQDPKVKIITYFKVDRDFTCINFSTSLFFDFHFNHGKLQNADRFT